MTPQISLQTNFKGIQFYQRDISASTLYNISWYRQQDKQQQRYKTLRGGHILVTATRQTNIRQNFTVIANQQ